ncbi:unnamed protein product [Parnassius mnemosyne]|uniref:Endonuclease/exonuclease/phosphatase domain-containing protein n=1 Tax=Parnassius mnemosyne TaxID=213953 RepID=A0AAV1M985_9NEOP
MATDSLLQQVPSAEIVILGDFNAHHAEWLGSRLTDHAGRSVYDFALAYGLTQLVTSPTRIPDVEDHTPSLLDLLLTSHPDGYQVSVDAVVLCYLHIILHYFKFIFPFCFDFLHSPQNWIFCITFISIGSSNVFKP